VRISFLALGCSLVSFAASAGPIGYVFDGDFRLGYRVDLATGVATSFPTFSGGYPVAIVDNKIRLGQVDDGTGFEYDLNGNLTGGTFSGGGQFGQLLDGTTNGIRNFAVECCAGINSVLAYNLFWQGGAVLFNLPAAGRGITYDTKSGTLWVALIDGTLHQYNMAGSDLGSFGLGYSTIGLAYNGATDTLWTINGIGIDGSVFREYNKSGQLLSQVNLVVTNDIEFLNPFGFEFNNGISAVPEPATFGLLGMALCLTALARRSWKKQIA
jgi:PEP-CTERM motif